MDDMAFDAHSNIEMVLRLLEAARIRGIKNFLFASSGGTVYGDPVHLPARESDPTDPRSSYGIIKLAIEKYINLYSRLYAMRGVVLRISNPYGSGQLSGTAIGVIARLLRHVHDGTNFSLWGDGGITRDYFHVDDLIRAFLLALDKGDMAAGVYNVGGGHGTSIDELVALVERVTGRSVAIDYRPPRSVDVPMIWLDTDKFRSATGWHPIIGLEEGIRRLWHELTERSAINHGIGAPRRGEPDVAPQT
jgi:UDP-glucose 4-epimerase